MWQNDLTHCQMSMLWKWWWHGGREGRVGEGKSCRFQLPTRIGASRFRCGTIYQEKRMRNCNTNSVFAIWSHCTVTSVGPAKVTYFFLWGYLKWKVYNHRPQQLRYAIYQPFIKKFLPFHVKWHAEWTTFVNALDSVWVVTVLTWMI